MPLPDERPLTADEISDIDRTALNTLKVVQQYVVHIRSVAVNPAVFLQIPVHHDLLQNLIDHYSILYDLLPRELFTLRMNEMIMCRDQLIEAEKTAPAQGDLPSLFTLELEISDRGFPRLAIPRDFVEVLINDAGMTNSEIADVLGVYCDEGTVRQRN